MQSTMETKIETSAKKNDLMKALAVIPGKPNTIHLREVPKPRIDNVPEGRGVLIKLLNVGVDGTDKEINAAEYGAAPPGDEYLIIGHESFGRVESVGPNVTESIQATTFLLRCDVRVRAFTTKSVPTI